MMNYDKANKILETFSQIPDSIRDLRSLIRMAGYERLKTKKGLKFLEECEAKQIRGAGRDYHKIAERIVNDYWKNIQGQENQEELPKRYHARLCNVFNVPPELRNQTPLNELEALLG